MTRIIRSVIVIFCIGHVSIQINKIMVGCCKFGPCRKKRTYEFNNPPYTENKEDGVYHSSKQKLTQTQTQNGSAAAARINPGFESASTENVEFNGAAVVDLDSECNSIAEETGAIARKDSKHKENAEGFKSADLVAAEGVKRKDSKRSSKSSHSSRSSSSKSSKRSSKHSADVVVNDKLFDHGDEVVAASVDDIQADVQVGESYTTVTTATITTTETHETHGDEEVEIEGGAVAYPEDEHHDHDETTKVSEVVVVKREEITTVSEDGAAVTRVEVTEEVISDTGGDKTPERRKSGSSQSSSSSSSSDANSYRVNEDEVQEETQEEQREHIEEVSATTAGVSRGSGSTSDDDESSGGIEPPPGIEELDNEANDMAEIRDGSYTVTHVTEEVTVNAHGDDAEHGDTGSEDL